MGAIPERYLRIALIAASVYFIVVGIFGVAYNAYILAVPIDAARDKTDEKDEDVKGDAIASIISGCLDVAVGIFGLIAVMLKKRLLLIIFAGILSVTVIANIVVMIITGTRHQEAKNETLKNSKDNMIRLYGNTTDDLSLGYTLQVNTHQRIESCCGWSNDPADNIYLKTPFYTAQVNAADLEEGKYRTLPEACCTHVSPACYRAKDLMKARADKVVYEDDCLEKMVRNGNFYLAVTLIKSILSSLLQIAAITATVLHVLQIE